MLVTYAIILFICSPFLWWYFYFLKKYKSLDNIPGPKPLPVIGNAAELGSTPQELLNNLFLWNRKYGDIFKIFVGNEVRVYVLKPQLIEYILSSNEHITKSGAYDIIKPWLGDGLLISKGIKWKVRRKMITPTFHFKILDQFIDIFNSAGQILVDKLSEEVGKESVDVFPFINLFSLDVICETAMGVQMNAQKNQNSEYLDAVRGFFNIAIIRMFSVWERFDLLFKLSPKYKSHKRHLKTLHEFTVNVIKQRRKLKDKGEELNYMRDDGIKRKIALLDMLLESEESNLLTNEDIREEIDTFMFEGHDTTTSGINFTVFALADHQDIQQKVYEELISVTGTEKNTNITMKNMQELKYLEMVLKEVQRYYPSVPFIERRLESDLSLGGYQFPKDTFLVFFMYGLHRCEDNFPDPNTFNPERFLPENQSKRHNFSYIPFSAGPRNCIGQKFAMYEMKATIAKIVKNFKILPVPNYKPDLGMAGILKSYNGICVRLEHR